VEDEAGGMEGTGVAVIETAWVLLRVGTALELLWTVRDSRAGLGAEAASEE